MRSISQRYSAASIFRVAALILAVFAPVRPASAAPNSIAGILASPDGRHIAIAYADGELALLDRERPGALPIYSQNLAGGYAWSADSSALALIERIPGQAPQMWVVRPEGGRDSLPLVGGNDWLAQPRWYDEDSILYLSDREADYVNIWRLDIESGQTRKFLDRGGDITGLWSKPGAEDFIFRSSESGSPELWWWWSSESEAIRITRDPATHALIEGPVTLSPSGQQIAYRVSGGLRDRIVFFDLEQQLEVGALDLDSRLEGIAMDSGGVVIVSLGSRLHHWNPAKKSRDPLGRGWDWKGLSLGLPTRLGRQSWAAVANGNLIVSATRIKELEDGFIHARSVDDLIYLGAKWQQAGRPADARAVLSDRWEKKSANPDEAYRIAALRALVERLGGKADHADRWLREALIRTPDGSAAETKVWIELLLVNAIERHSVKRAEDVLSEMPSPIRDAPAARWVTALLQTESKKIRGAWQEALAAGRNRQWADCALGAQRLVRSDPYSELHRGAVALLLRDEFDPLEDLLDAARTPPEELLDQIAFQDALAALSGGDFLPEVSKENVRGMLLSQWAKAGQLDPARNIVALDLRDPSGPVLDYFDMLDRYLDPEEQEEWMERAVGSILLAPDIATKISRHMSDTEAHLVFTLSKAKSALIEGDVEKLKAELDQLERDLGIIPASFWDRRSGRYLLLTRLYLAKYFERRERWDQALDAYAACQEVIERFPGDWGIIAFDLELARSLVEVGRADGDLLRTFLQTLRGLGDPLINPAHEVATLNAALQNLQTIRAYAGQEWVAPFLDYVEGVLMAIADRPYFAIAALERARAHEPIPALVDRILLEEAVVRQGLGQHRLAAKLLARLGDRPLDPARLTVVINTRAQAEKNCALILSQEDRIRFLCRELRLPRAWAATLIGDHTVLPLEGAEDR